MPYYRKHFEKLKEQESKNGGYIQRVPGVCQRAALETKMHVFFIVYSQISDIL